MTYQLTERGNIVLGFALITALAAIIATPIIAIIWSI